MCAGPAWIVSLMVSSLTGAKPQASTPTLIWRPFWRHFSWTWPCNSQPPSSSGRCSTYLRSWCVSMQVREVADPQLLVGDHDGGGVVDDVGDAANLVVRGDLAGAFAVALPACVVVAGHENLAALEPSHMRGEVDGELVHHQVAEHPHLVAVGDDVVPTIHHRCGHRIRVDERATAVADDVGVPEVLVGRPPSAHGGDATGPLGHAQAGGTSRPAGTLSAVEAAAGEPFM